MLEKEVLDNIGNGVSELINLCMQALLDNGDEILIPSPDYPMYVDGKNVHTDRGDRR